MKLFVMFAAVLLVASCALPGGNPSSAGTATPATSASSDPPPPPVPLDQVLAAVAAAQQPQPLPATITPQDLTAIAHDDMSLWGMPKCNPWVPWTSLTPERLANCTIGDVSSPKTLAVVGDSNAFMWSEALKLVGERNHWKIVVFGKDNCGPAELHYYLNPEGRDFIECDAWQVWRTQTINDMKPDAVLFVGWVGGNFGPGKPVTMEVWRDGLIASAQKLPAGTKTAFLSNAPHITKIPGQCLSQNTQDVTVCAEPASVVVPADANTAYQQAAETVGGTYVDDTPWFCGELCPIVINGTPAYSSRYHTNHLYTTQLSGVLGEALQPAMS